MPGISLLCCLDGPVDGTRPKFQQALQSACLFDDYAARIDFQDSRTLVGSACYPAYPLCRMESPEMVVWLDGRIYGIAESRLQSELLSLAGEVFRNWGSRQDRLGSWMLSTDSEFVLVAHHKPTGRWACWNDLCCRLPLYLYRESACLALSRNIHVVSALAEPRRFDRMAIAQFLLFDFSLETRTFLENVQRVPAATLVRIDPKSGQVHSECLNPLNFETKEHAGKSLDRNAREIAERFTQACALRENAGRSTVVSLSGGLDSRVVAAGLKKAGVDFQALTWIDSRQRAALEVRIAEQVARTLDIPWRLFELKPAVGRDLFEVLRIKLGQIYLASAHLLQHLRNARELGGPGMTYMTGNGGDHLHQDLRPVHPIRSRHQLVQTLLGPQYRASRGDLSVETVARLTGFSPGDILGELDQVVFRYPEQDINQKYIHFHLSGYYFKRYHEGDDRNRSFFWSTSPFWSTPLFVYLCNCPDNQKKGHRLYSRYLAELDPDLGRINRVPNNQPCTLPIGAPEPGCTPSPMGIPKTVWQPMKAAWKRIRRRVIPTTGSTPRPQGYVHYPTLLDCLRKQVEENPVVQNTLSGPVLGDILAHSDQYNGEAIGLLVTITSMLEYVSDGTSSILSFADAILDSYT
jgi:asparagine synthase (glutamine-hydrolysing)